MPRPSFIAAAITAVAALGYAGAAAVGVAAQTTAHAQDLLWPAGDTDPHIVVVAVDQPSIEQMGQWPWPRTMQARLLRAIASSGASAVGYDVLLTAPEDGDTELADAMGGVPTVIAETWSTGQSGDNGLLEVSGAVPPTSQFTGAAASIGHAVVTADSDGVTRTVPTVVAPPDSDFVGSLALRTVDASDGQVDQLYIRPGDVQTGNLTVPTEDAAAVRVRWADNLRMVSAAQVLNGTADRSMFHGAVVFVGVTAVGLGDQHVTPLSPGVTTPGVVVQAQVASTILSNTWIVPVPWWASAAFVLLTGFVLAWAALRWKLRWVVVATSVMVAAYTVAAVVVFDAFGWLPDLVRVPTAMLATVIAGVSVRLLTEQAARRKAVALFTRYVPGHVAEQLLRDGRAADAAAGQRVIVGLVFADLRGFTPLAATLQPAEVRGILDRYYDYACTIIFRHGGTVMQFVGDEVFAVFGAPEPVDDPAGAARDAGLELQFRAAELTAALEAAGLPSVQFGVGVHVGEVVAAHVGPADRRQYAVIGDPVNVGSRLCGAAGAGEVIMSQLAAGDLAGVAEMLLLKGLGDPVQTVRLASVSNAT